MLYTTPVEMKTMLKYSDRKYIEKDITYSPENHW